MPQYLLNVIQPDGEPPEPAVLEPIMADLRALHDEIVAAGQWVFTSHLHPASAATVVRRQGGESRFNDGPYVEASEHNGGFTLIEGGDLDAALVWAGKVADVTTLPIEVRPVA
jgi:hypothetical protein